MSDYHLRFGDGELKSGLLENVRAGIWTQPTAHSLVFNRYLASAVRALLCCRGAWRDLPALEVSGDEVQGLELVHNEGPVLARYWREEELLRSVSVSQHFNESFNARPHARN